MEFEQELAQRAEEILRARETPTQEAPVTEVAPSPEQPLQERAKDYIGVLATQMAVQDEELVGDIAARKKEELRQSAQAHLLQEQAENKSAEIRLQQANYGVYEGVASYAGIKKPLPQYMQKIIFVFLSILQCIWLITLGTMTSIINITAEQIDSVVKRLASIAKSARVLVLSLFGLAVIALICYITVTYLKRYNIIV